MKNVKVKPHYSIKENLPDYNLIPRNMDDLLFTYNLDDMIEVIYQVKNDVDYCLHKYNYPDYDQDMVKQLKDLKTYLDDCLVELNGVKNVKS